MAKEEPKTKVRVRAVPEKGFCRIGLKFGRDPQTIEVDAKQLAIIQAEKMLVVEILPEEKAADEKKK